MIASGNRGAVLHSARDLRIEQLLEPVPTRSQVVVTVHAVGICGSDVHYYDHGRIGRYVVESPMVVGHEAAGRIVSVGEAVPSSRIGEAVALEPGIPCGRCSQCRRGRYNLCPEVSFFATPPVDGAIVQRVAIEADFAHPVPPGVDFASAAMAEPVSVGVWAARTAGIGFGDRVLVTGAGPVGLFSAQVARAFGARRVTMVDTNPFRLEVARSLGFDTRAAGESSDDEVDVLLECSGAPVALASAMGSVARSGRVVLIGMGSDRVEFDLPTLQGHEIRVSAIFRYANTYPDALDLIARGLVRVAPVITHRFGLDDTEDALTLARREPRSLKAVVAPVPESAAVS